MLLVTPLLAFGQRPSRQDAELFKAYFYDSLSYSINLRKFVSTCTKVEQAEHEAIKRALSGKSFKKLKLGPQLSIYLWAPEQDYGTSYDAPIYHDSLSYFKLFGMYYGAHFFVDSMNLERARMKRYIRMFRQQATSLPLFYNIIDKAFHGNSDAYVDDLFDHSIFSSTRNFVLFYSYSFSTLRLRMDPLVVYSICRAQYMNEAKHNRPNELNSIQFLSEDIDENPDRKLFKEYFVDSIWTKVDLMAISNIYYFTKRVNNKAMQYGASVLLGRDNEAQYKIYEKYDSYFFLLKDMYTRLHLGYNEAEDKVRMKRFIKDFRLKATKLPTFYAYIDERFNGNSDAYVDYLFERSIFSNEDRFMKLKKWLKVKKLNRDPMVKYTLSVMQYLYCD